MLAKLRIYQKHVKELLNLAFPMIVGNLGIILIGAGSVFVAAKYSTDTLAAVSIATSIISCIFMFGIGLLTSVSPLLSNLRGQRNSAKKYFLSTIIFAMILAIISMAIILLSVPLVERIGFDPKLMPGIRDYMIICAFSTFGGYLHASLKEFLQAYEIVFFPNFIAIFSVILNVYLSFVFVFGWYGLPELGTAGLAWAAVAIRTMEGLCLLIYCLSFIRVQKYLEFRYCINLIKIGLPIAMAILFEFLAFNLVTVVMGRVSGIFAASQSILLTISTVTFMVPLAISTAIAVKVGFANGAENHVDMKRYSIAGTLVSVAFMSLCALVFILFPTFCVRIFTQDINLIKICVPIMLIVGIFQVFDGLQVSLSGIFKGLKKTNIVMAGDLFAYWALGLPLGFILAFKYHMNLYGFWVGLAISIFTLGVGFLLILIRHFAKINHKNHN